MRPAGFALLLLSLWHSPLLAAAEPVHVLRVFQDDRAVLMRRNGETWLVENGVGCLSLWQMEGRAILVDSPGLFLGVGSSLVLPDHDQQCRIWNGERIILE